MSHQYARVEHEGALTIVTLDRPLSRNALNAAAHRELEKIFDAFARDDDQWVAIITGAGEVAFCAGHDLKEHAAGGGLEFPRTGFAGLTARFDLNKPVIAAVNGAAMGGGFEIALACDIVVAAQSAYFALPEPGVGLAALAGGIHRLPRAIGLKRAMDILLTGRRVDAREAFALGFVSEVVDGDVLGAAKRWARTLLTCSPMSLRATKEAALQGLSLSVKDALDAQWHYPAVKALLASEEYVEGPSAFAEKRIPNWSGR